MAHREHHVNDRIGWLRAAVLGANDGILSTASLIVGVAASAATRQQTLVAGIAGLVAGALSMAAGEYVSVSSQRDTERASLDLERHELATQPKAEEDELTGIYVDRGLDPDLARVVARQLMAKDALAAHARDELGLTEELAARPLQAALASAATFAVGAGVPVVAARATGAVDLVKDGVTGYLVEPTDIAGYADAIARIVADPALKRAMGEAGHARAAGYRWDTANQAVLDTYLELHA